MRLPLDQLNVLVTRPEEEGVLLCDEIRQLGGQAFHLPTIKIVPSNEPLTASELEGLIAAHFLIFISRHAVRLSLSKIQPTQAKIIAIGGGTASALMKAGIEPDIVPSIWSSEGVLNLPCLEAIRGKTIGIVKGEGGRPLLEETLLSRGAQVFSLTVYKRIIPPLDVTPFLTRLQAGEMNAIVCTSFESIKNLERMVGESAWSYVQKMPLVVLSQRIKILAHDLGFRTIWVAAHANHEAILKILIQESSLWQKR